VTHTVTIACQGRKGRSPRRACDNHEQDENEENEAPTGRSKAKPYRTTASAKNSARKLLAGNIKRMPRNSSRRNRFNVATFIVIIIVIAIVIVIGNAVGANTKHVKGLAAPTNASIYLFFSQRSTQNTNNPLSQQLPTPTLEGNVSAKCKSR
jgi:hypothetical protein